MRCSQTRLDCNTIFQKGIKMNQVPLQQGNLDDQYGFHEKPFGVAADPRFFWDGGSYGRSLASLARGIESKQGLLLLTGEVGTGKTLLTRKLMNDLTPRVRFIFLSANHLTSHDLFDLITRELGLTKKNTRLETIEDIKKALRQQLDKGHTVALIIDEAQRIRGAVFDSLCSLSDLETDNQKLLQIVLVGHTDILTKLNKPSLRQLYQRIAVHVRLRGLSTVDDVKTYITHRLQVARYTGPEVFINGASEVIWRRSSGLPRRINFICDSSLASASHASSREVSAAMADQAADDLDFTTVEHTHSAGPLRHIESITESKSVRPNNRSEPITPSLLPTDSSGAQFEQNDLHFKKSAGLRWKIGAVFSGMGIALAIALLVSAYPFADRMLRNQLEKRALTIATNLSDTAAGYMMGEDLLRLNTMLRKYTLLDGLAYAFVQNTQGAIVAHTLGTFPAELRDNSSARNQRVTSRRELSWHDKAIYEISVPVLDGQIGRVTVGFWTEEMTGEIRQGLLPLVAVVGIIAVAGIILSFVAAHWIVRPITRLTKVADRITRGDLETADEYPKSHDEIGELARSLGRMRASLKAAMSRLDHQST